MNYLALLFVSVIWGGAFVFQRTTMDHMGPFTLNGARFFLAAFTVFAIRVIGWKQVSITKKELDGGLILGLILFMASTFQQVGMVYTSAGKGGFITGMYIALVPIFLVLFWKRKIDKFVWLGVFVAIFGLYLLSVTQELSITTGDGFVAACACVYAMHVIMVTRLGRDKDPLALSIVQMGVTCVLSTLVALAIESPALSQISLQYSQVGYLGILSAGIGYTVQLVAQKHVPEVVAGLILSLESVFAAIAGAVFIGEALTERQVIGCVVMLVGISIAQIATPTNRATSNVS